MVFLYFRTWHGARIVTGLNFPVLWPRVGLRMGVTSQAASNWQRQLSSATMKM